MPFTVMIGIIQSHQQISDYLITDTIFKICSWSSFGNIPLLSEAVALIFLWHVDGLIVSEPYWTG